MKRIAPRKSRRPAAAISVLVEEPQWRTEAAALRLIRRAVRLALSSPLRAALPPRRRKKDLAVTILLTGDERLRSLNKQFRGKNRPTNVLSFPEQAASTSL